MRYPKTGKVCGGGALLNGLVSGILEQACGQDNVRVQIEVALNEVFTKEFIKKNDPINMLEDKIMLLRADQRSEIWRAVKFKKNENWDKSTKAKHHECKCLYQVALRRWKRPQKGHGIYHLIVPGRVRFIEVENNKDVCEFDGAFMTVVKKRGVISSLKFRTS